MRARETYIFLFYCDAAHRHLHSFPTRRSSDLLLENGLRTRLGLIAEAGDAWDVHHFASLIGYGAEAVHPWLALESDQRSEEHTSELQSRGHLVCRLLLEKKKKKQKYE